MDDAQFELLFLNTSRAGEHLPLAAELFQIGRSRSNTLALEDALISRQHLLIRKEGGSIIAEDTGSSHGTFLNDKRIRGSVSLKDGDILQLGDVKLKFAAVKQADREERPDSIGAAESRIIENRATEFAEVAVGSETRFMSRDEKDEEDDDLGKTRVIGDGETRLMDVAELKGLRAAPRAPVARKKKVLIAVLAVLAVLTAVMFMVKGGGEDGDGAGSLSVSHANEQYSLSVAAPYGWKLTQGGNGALFGFEYKFASSRPPARMDVYGDRHQDYRTTGLRAGFEAYRETIAARHQDLKFQGNKIMVVNNVTTVFYAFSAQKEKGKGLFLLSGDKRICLEYSVPEHGYQTLEKPLNNALRTLRLNGAQEFIDFPPPTEAIRRLGLANKDHLVAMAKRDLDIGKELFKNRGVRPENLYMSRQALMRCLTTASAVGERPDFHAEAAMHLAEATRCLDGQLRDQKFRIIVAEQRHDVEQAYWESVKLAQMIPDKTSEHHQFAASRIEFYSKKRQ